MSESPGSVTVSTLQRNILPHAVPSVIRCNLEVGGASHPVDARHEEDEHGDEDKRNHCVEVAAKVEIEVAGVSL